MATIATIVFLKNHDEVLLFYKKRGFGVHKWNGPGGKVNKGESNLEAAIRETKEEVNLHATNLEKRAELHFYAGNELDWVAHVYFGTEFTGEMQESEEGRPQWFKISDISYNQMWVDDIFWLPHLLNGKYMKGRFNFDEKLEELYNHNIEFIESFN